MPGDIYKHVNPGDKVGLRAPSWNAAMDAAKFVQDRLAKAGAGGGQFFPQSGIIDVYNDTGVAHDQFDVLGVDGPMTGPDTDEDEFRYRLTLNGIIPEERGVFVVLQEPLDADGIAKAVIAGLTIVRVEGDVSVGDLVDADLTGTTEFLVADSSGTGRVVWVGGWTSIDATSGSGSGSGADLRWALVLLGAGGGSALWGKLNADADSGEDVEVTVWTGLPFVPSGDNAETATARIVTGHMPDISLPMDTRVRLAVTGGFPSGVYDIQPYSCATGSGS